MDDILIYSDDPLEHEEHVYRVLKRLRTAGLQVDIKKYKFSVTETKYLGFIVSTEGIRVDPDKVATVKYQKVPRNVKEMQSSFRFYNFYRRFIRNFGRIARPLNRLTKKAVQFNFNNSCIEAFKWLKGALISAPVLILYDSFTETRMETDSLDGVITGVLSQKGKDGEWHPVAYYSKVMNSAEINYEIHDKEMLALMHSLAEQEAELKGLQATPFTAITDHRALKYFTTKRLLNIRQARQVDKIAIYDFKIVYRPGRENIVTNTLLQKAEDVKT